MLDSNPVTGQCVKYLLPLPILESLSMQNTQVGDEVGIWLPQMTDSLGGLRLDRSRVTNAIGDRLPPGLSELGISGTRIDSTFLQRMSASDNLTWFNLDDTNIDDAGLLELGKFPNLRVVLICGTQVSDRGFEQIGILRKLEVLGIDNTRIGSEGITNIRKFPQLESLSIRETHVTPDCLAQVVAENPRLQVLTVSPKSVGAFKAAVNGHVEVIAY